MAVEKLREGQLNNFLQEEVGINSISLHEQQIADYFEDVLGSIGFDVQRQVIDDTGRANLLAQRGNSPSVLFYGHMDTVDTTQVKIPESWKTDPFKLEEIEEGMFYGLGASDMKGGIAAFFEAAASTSTPMKIFLGVDEERISEGAWKAVKKRPEFFKGVDLIISSEPSFGLGLSGVTNGRTGRCEYQILFRGNPEHIMNYRTAIDALQKASDFGSILYERRDEMFDSPDTMVHLKRVNGEAAWMSVCGEATVDVEVFLGPGDSVDNVMGKLQKITDDTVELKPRKTPYLEGYYFEDFPFRDRIGEIINDQTGKEMTLHQRTSVADDNVLATLRIPVITWGSVGGNEHKPNEYVDMQSLIELSGMYKSLLEFIGDKKK